MCGRWPRCQHAELTAGYGCAQRLCSHRSLRKLVRMHTTGWDCLHVPPFSSPYVYRGAHRRWPAGASIEATSYTEGAPPAEVCAHPSGLAPECVLQQGVQLPGAAASDQPHHCQRLLGLHSVAHHCLLVVSPCATRVCVGLLNLRSCTQALRGNHEPQPEVMGGDSWARGRRPLCTVPVCYVLECRHPVWRRLAVPAWLAHPRCVRQR